uniref:Vesicle transport protein n=1 Tax=Elaeophora elaphi TaxID=1147741 RepID=A0A158Q811_9BILA
MHQYFILISGYDMLQRVYRLFDDDDESQDVANLSNSPTDGTSQNQFDETSSLSWDLRIQCFLGCLCLSVICSLGGSALLFNWRLTGFTVMVSLGSILSLFGTCFLMGPLKQLQKMFERGRFLASLMYLLSIVFTLIAGLVFSSPPLALVFLVGQYIAMAWYSITYIPFARYNFVLFNNCFHYQYFLQEAILSLCCNWFN